MSFPSTALTGPGSSSQSSHGRGMNRDTPGTDNCFLLMDEQFLQCFHVYCTDCCNQLTVRKELEMKDCGVSSKITLQCATCQIHEPYPAPKAAPGEPGGLLHQMYIGQGKDTTGGGGLSLYDTSGLTCELLSLITKKSTACNVTRTPQNLYQITYRPVTRGEHQLSVRINGKHIRGSPLTVVTRVPIETIEKPMVVIKSFERPWGIIVKNDGDMVITEHGAHCISSCNKDGVKTAFGLTSSGTRGVTFVDPRGIATDHCENLFVVDGKLCCVFKFTSDGILIVKVGKKGNKALEFSSPVGVAVHPSNKKVYVADNGNHRIQILNPDLTFCHAFGKQGKGEAELNFPWDIAFDSVGKVYVVDSWNHRVQVFSEDGRHLMQIGAKGRDRGRLYWPSSICIDAEDFVYVVEAQNHRISVFNSDGRFMTLIGRKGRHWGEFIEPTGVAVDRYRVIYVSDSGNNRVQIF